MLKALTHEVYIMAMTRVERQLKMMNDVAKYKSADEAKQFKIDVLMNKIQNQGKYNYTNAEVEIFQSELEKLK